MARILNWELRAKRRTGAASFGLSLEKWNGHEAPLPWAWVFTFGNDGCGRFSDAIDADSSAPIGGQVLHPLSQPTLEGRGIGAGPSRRRSSGDGCTNVG